MQQSRTVGPVFHDWLMLVCIDIGVIVGVLWEYKSGNVTLALAVTIAFIILTAGNLFTVSISRKRHRKLDSAGLRGMIRNAIILAVISLCVIGTSLHAISPANDYLRIARSNVPLNEIQPEKTRLLVELIRARAANSRENDKDLDQARKHPLNPPLYSALSFSSVELMDRTVASLTEWIAADAAYYAKQQAVMEHFRQQMGVTDQSFLKDWDRKREAQETSQAHAEALQRDWLNTVKTLYGFTRDHADAFSIHDGKLAFKDQALAFEFQNDMNKCKATNDQFMTEEKQVIAIHDHTKKDLSLQ